MRISTSALMAGWPAVVNTVMAVKLGDIEQMKRSVISSFSRLTPQDERSRYGALDVSRVQQTTLCGIAGIKYPPAQRGAEQLFQVEVTLRPGTVETMQHSAIDSLNVATGNSINIRKTHYQKGRGVFNAVHSFLRYLPSKS